MQDKIKAMREAYSLDHPINASVVLLLTLSLRRLTQQLADGEEFAGDDPERLLEDLYCAADYVCKGIKSRLNPHEEKEPI